MSVRAWVRVCVIVRAIQDRESRDRYIYTADRDNKGKGDIGSSDKKRYPISVSLYSRSSFVRAICFWV